MIDGAELAEIQAYVVLLEAAHQLSGIPAIDQPKQTRHLILAAARGERPAGLADGVWREITTQLVGK